jgi:hypothetical protein
MGEEANEQVASPKKQKINEDEPADANKKRNWLGWEF